MHVITDTNYGGVSTYMLTFLDHYDPRRLDLEILLPRKSVVRAELDRRNVRCTEVEGLEDASLNGKAVRSLVRLFSEKKPDIVQTHAAMSARIAARLYGQCKIISTRHSVFDPPKRATVPPLKQIYGFVNHVLSDRIIAVSPAAKTNLVDTGTDPERVEVVYNGAKAVKPASEPEKALLRRKYGIGSDDFVVTIIGRLVVEKGQETVMRAAELLAEEPDIKIVMAGTGALEKKLREKAASLPQVVMTGFIKEIYEIENITDVMLNASTGTEATSLALLEGMSLGKPSVVTDFGGNPYVIEDEVSGLVIPQRDPEAMKNAILRLKKDAALYSLCGKNARKAFESRFTAQAMTEETIRIYEEMMRLAR